MLSLMLKDSNLWLTVGCCLSDLVCNTAILGSLARAPPPSVSLLAREQSGKPSGAPKRQLLPVVQVQRRALFPTASALFISHGQSAPVRSLAVTVRDMSFGKELQPWDNKLAQHPTQAPQKRRGPQPSSSGVPAAPPMRRPMSAAASRGADGASSRRRPGTAPSARIPVKASKPKLAAWVPTGKLAGVVADPRLASHSRANSNALRQQIRSKKPPLLATACASTPKLTKFRKRRRAKSAGALRSTVSNVLCCGADLCGRCTSTPQMCGRLTQQATEGSSMGMPRGIAQRASRRHSLL